MPSAAAKEPEEYALFLESLGITDKPKVSFLASLLRDVYETSAKLDLHLEPHGASFHSAISRLLTTDNPHDVPSLCWIRVVDRMGFFTDGDEQAKRIVNVGLAFAYRHKQLDTLAASGVLMQEADAVKKMRAVEVGVGHEGNGGGGAKKGAEEEGADDQGADIAAGGVAFDRPPAAEAPSAAGAAAVAGGGDQEDGVDRGGVVIAKRSGTSTATALVEAGGGGDGDEQGASGVAPGGVVVACRPRGAPTPTRRDGGDSDHQGGESDVTGLPSTVHERQPFVRPSADALKAVSFVLDVVEERDDAPAVLRGLLSESLTCMLRSRPSPKSEGPSASSTRGGGGGCPVHTMVEPWWPMWQAPRDGTKMRPVPGTFGYEVNSLRAVWSTRWCIKVDMDKIKCRLDRIRANHPKAFEPGGPRAVEVVVRLVQARPLRLTIVIACFLLMATKEPGYSSVLMKIAATGRAQPQRATRLAAASVHEFVASAVTNSQPSGRRHHQPGSDDPAAAAPPPKDVFVGVPKQPLDAQYASMAVKLAAEKVDTAAERRASRKRVLQRKADRAAPTSRVTASQPPTRRGDADTEPVAPGQMTAGARARKRPRSTSPTSPGGVSSTPMAARGDGSLVAQRATSPPVATIDTASPLNSAVLLASLPDLRSAPLPPIQFAAAPDPGAPPC